jgi:hypothetical protein
MIIITWKVAQLVASSFSKVKKKKLNAFSLNDFSWLAILMNDAQGKARAFHKQSTHLK